MVDRRKRIKMIRDFFKWLEALPEWIGIPLALAIPFLLFGLVVSPSFLEANIRRMDPRIKPEDSLTWRDWVGGIVTVIAVGLCLIVFCAVVVPLMVRELFRREPR